MSRDPRVDPRPGDVLSGLNGGRSERRTVIERTPLFVLYTRGRRVSAKWTSSIRSLDEWRTWARKADVEHVAEVAE